MAVYKPTALRIIVILAPLILVACSNLGYKNREIESLPRYPNAENENIGMMVTLPGKNGTVKERIYTFETKDEVADIILFYEQMLSDRDWQAYKGSSTEIEFIMKRNCPFHAAHITVQSRNNVTFVEARLTREPCR